MCFYFHPENFATPIARQDSMTSPASIPLHRFQITKFSLKDTGAFR
jgi:hypothetical protein